MGASEWRYDVPFQADVAAALAELRRATFERGEYYREEPDPTLALTEEEYVAFIGDDGGLGYNESLIEQWREARQSPPPVDPDSLFRSQPHAGTHSIIDMVRGVSATPANLTVSPLTPEQTQESFGTLKPTREQVAAWTRVAQFRDRWEGAYVVSFDQNGDPERLHFVGYSGD